MSKPGRVLTHVCTECAKETSEPDVLDEQEFCPIPCEAGDDCPRDHLHAWTTTPARTPSPD